MVLLCSVTEIWQAPGIGNGFKQGIMCVLRKIFEVLPDQRRDEHNGDPPTGSLRQAAAGVVTLTLVPGEDNEIVRTVSFQGGDEWSKSIFKPSIRHLERAVMGAVAKVR